jgi:hypothetical protein
VRHFHRTSLTPADVMVTADGFFRALGMKKGASDQRTCAFSGALGTVRLSVRMEGGHYTLIDVATDQVGESRLDKNVKQLFVTLHRQADPRHLIDAAY